MNPRSITSIGESAVLWNQFHLPSEYPTIEIFLMSTPSLADSSQSVLNLPCYTFTAGFDPVIGVPPSVSCGDEDLEPGFVVLRS